MVFIYPIQFILHSAGVHDPWILIFAGRIVVIFFSALSLWLVYRIARRLFSSIPIGILALVFLAMSKLHTSFASTELPRTVASFFVLLSCWLLISEKNTYGNAALSAVLLGIGAALRFSEVIFIVPAVLFLACSKRRRQALVLGVIFMVILLIILGLSDALYWKSPWYSLKNIVDYTLVKKLSSRGYESPLYYLLSVGIWSDFLTIGLACFALKLRNRLMCLWAFSALLMLSFLPHKEPRYLVPAVPFMAIMAGLSAWHFLEQNLKTGFVLYLPRKQTRPFLALTLFALGTVLLSSKDYRFAYVTIPLLLLVIWFYSRFRPRSHITGANEVPNVSPVRLGLILILTVLAMGALEIEGFRLRRTESGVEMARFLAHRADLRSVAIEDAWKAGGRLYLWRYQTIMNIDETLFLKPEQLIQEVKAKDVQAIGLTDEHVRGLKYEDLLRSHGYEEVSFSGKKRLHRYRLFIKG
jgi:4-amino-4-deoxy-L-arabinose transferase-like glycosyltransferase